MELYFAKQWGDFGRGWKNAQSTLRRFDYSMFQMKLKFTLFIPAPKITRWIAREPAKAGVQKPLLAHWRTDDESGQLVGEQGWAIETKKNGL